LKKKLSKEWKKRPSQSRENEVPLTTMMEELPSDQVDPESPEALALELQVQDLREVPPRRSSESESSR
jgi:hypothetical protein